MMSAQEFDRKLAEIDQGHAERRDLATAWRDQEMARLFTDCGWTQERIAERMGKKQQWVSRRLIFGRFLIFTPVGVNVASLTEGRFREHWQRTKGTEKDRFAAVLHAMEHGIPHGIEACSKKPGVKSAVRKVMADGKWYTSAQILASVEETLPGVTTKQITNCLTCIRLYGIRGQKLETKTVGRAWQYRLVECDELATVSPVAALYVKAAPLLDELEEIGHAHLARLSPRTVAMIAVKLRHLFESVLEGAAT